MTLTFKENHFVLQNANLPKTFFGAAWKPHAQFAFKTRDIKEAVRFRKHADSKAQRIFNKLMLTQMPLPAGGLLSPIPLMDFQKDLGVPFILSRNRSYLAHQPGLGKTAQCIVAVNSKPGRTLVIVPSFLKTTWAREITKWSAQDFPSIAVVPESSKADKFEWDADYIICSDAMLIKRWVIRGLSMQRFRYVFIDEAHRFKNCESSRTTALFGGKTKTFKSPGLIYNSEHVCALSGTPMLNRPIELWSTLYAMAPETIDFMSMTEFGRYFCGGFIDHFGAWNFNGASNESELNQRIMGAFMQRIRKEDVLKDLPEKIREVILIDKDIRSPDVQEFDSKVLRKLEGMSDVPESLGEYAIIRHLNGLAKVGWTASFVSEYLNAGESIILFAHHRDVVATLAEMLLEFRPMVINGSTDQADRTQYQDLFQSGKRKLIIGNIDAMNLGLTLTKATRVVFSEYAWTPALNEQAEDRAHRIGQHDSVFVQYLVLPNSIDERMLARLLEKQETISKVIG